MPRTVFRIFCMAGIGLLLLAATGCSMFTYHCAYAPMERSYFQAGTEVSYSPRLLVLPYTTELLLKTTQGSYVYYYDRLLYSLTKKTVRALQESDLFPNVREGYGEIIAPDSADAAAAGKQAAALARAQKADLILTSRVTRMLKVPAGQENQEEDQEILSIAYRIFDREGKQLFADTITRKMDKKKLWYMYALYERDKAPRVPLEDQCVLSLIKTLAADRSLRQWDQAQGRGSMVLDNPFEEAERRADGTINLEFQSRGVVAWTEMTGIPFVKDKVPARTRPPVEIYLDNKRTATVKAEPFGPETKLDRFFLRKMKCKKQIRTTAGQHLLKVWFDPMYAFDRRVSEANNDGYRPDSGRRFRLPDKLISLVPGETLTIRITQINTENFGWLRFEEFLYDMESDR